MAMTQDIGGGRVIIGGASPGLVNAGNIVQGFMKNADGTVNAWNILLILGGLLAAAAIFGRK
jgi:hypothetical protein